MAKKKQVEKEKEYSRYLTIIQADGTPKQLKYRGKTPEEAKEKRDRAKMEYERGLLVVNSRSTFAFYASAYMKEYTDTHSYTTTADTQRRIDQHLMPHLGALLLTNIRLIHLKRCLNGLQGTSFSNVKKTYDIIRSVFASAYSNGLISRNPVADLNIPDAPKGTRRALTDLEREAFLKAIKKHRFGLFFAIMYFTGHRPGEVRAHTIFDVKDERLLNVGGAAKRGGVDVGAPKTRAGYRQSPIPDYLWDMIQEHLAKRKEDDSPYLFHDYKGRPRTEQYLQRNWESFLRLMDIEAGAKLKDGEIIAHSDIGWNVLTPYYLRHTFCTDTLEMELPEPVRKHVMGHASGDMTNGVYTHITPTMLERARQKMNQYYEQKHPSKTGKSAATEPVKLTIKRHVTDIMLLKPTGRA